MERNRREAVISFVNKHIFGGRNKTVTTPYILLALVAFIIGSTIYYVFLFDEHYLFVRSMINAALLITFIVLERSPFKRETLSYLSPIAMVSIMTVGIVYFEGDFLVHTFAFAGALFSLAYMNPKGLAIYVVFVSALQTFFLFILNYNIMGHRFTIWQNYAGLITTFGLNVVLVIFCSKYEKITRAKEMFLSNMSHEMRTPLNAIIGFSELTLEDKGLDKKLYSNLINIRTAGTTLLSLISDLLDISKIETGNFELIPGEYDTAAMINSALAQNILHKGEKSIDFTLTVDENFPAKLFGDELKIRQVLNNLLSNAFKYTEEGRVDFSISFAVDNDNIWVTVEVSDTGKGIRSEELVSIFDDFVQADISVTRNMMGTGLGLPIARRLVRLMDGDILATSEYGKGSVFTARFRQKFVSNDVLSSEIIDSLKNFRYSEQKRIMTENMPLPSLSYAHVMVVDDVPTNLAVAAGLLKRYNINTYCVSNGPEAIEAIKSEKVHFKAIFMDHLMPDMDGIEAARLIREIDSEYAKTIPIIAFTANAIMGNEEMFLGNDFQAFITKPIELPQLDTIVRKWISDEQQEGDSAEKLLHAETKSTEDSLTPSVLLDYSIEGIDFINGLERYDGDTDTYINIMRSFAKNIPQRLANAEAVTESDLAKYTTAIHGIKGSCYSICADNAAKLADALEVAGKAGDYEFILANNAAFVEKVRSILSGIDEVLAKMQTVRLKGQMAKPDIKLLEKLRDACNRRNVSEVDVLVENLDSFEYESDSGLVQWLREMADEMKYAEIAKRLEKLSD